MPDTDRIAARLRRAPVLDDVRASAWDAFHEAADQDDLAKRLRGLSLPDDVKADLWDLKAGRVAEPPPSGVRVPGDSFGDKIKNAAGVLGRRPVSAEDFMTPQDIANRDMTGMDIVKGAGKGVVRSAAGIVNMAAQSRMIPGLNVPPQVVDRFTPQYANDAQELGGTMETAAELAVPAVRGAKAVAGAVPAMARNVGPVARTAGGVALDVATGHPLRAAGKVLGFILDAAKKAAAAAPAAVRSPVPFTGTGMAPATVPRGGFSMPPVRPAAPPAAVPPTGRLVPAKAIPVEDEIAAALADVPKPMPRVTTPPAAQLPAGYTPRTSAPKLRAVPPPAAPAAPPKRAYFLKPKDELAAVADDAPIAPSGTVTPDALPAAWQQHIGQDLFPLTGKEGDAVAAELLQELTSRGLSVGDAMMAVSKNPEVPVQLRQQLLKSLSRVKVKH